MKVFDNFQKLKETNLLPPQRKQALRRHLSTQIHNNQQLASPGLWKWLSQKLLARPLVIIVAAAVLIIAAGTGTATAANKALPGNALYPIKIYVNEPVRAALTIQSDARAVYETELAAKRIAEVQALATEGQLDEATQTELTQEFTNHVQRVQVRVQNNQDDQFIEVQNLLDQARTKLESRDYQAAVDLSRQASMAAHNRSSKNTAGSVKGQTTDKSGQGNHGASKDETNDNSGKDR